MATPPPPPYIPRIREENAMHLVFTRDIRTANVATSFHTCLRPLRRYIACREIVGAAVYSYCTRAPKI